MTNLYDFTRADWGARPAEFVNPPWTTARSGT